MYGKERSTLSKTKWTSRSRAYNAARSNRKKFIHAVTYGTLTSFQCERCLAVGIWEHVNKELVRIHIGTGKKEHFMAIKKASKVCIECNMHGCKLPRISTGIEVHLPTLLLCYVGFPKKQKLRCSMKMFLH